MAAPMPHIVAVLFCACLGCTPTRAATPPAAPDTEDAPHDPSPPAADAPPPKPTPTPKPGVPLTDAAFQRGLERMAAMPADRIGAVGGGPIRPGDDVLIARELVTDATRAQLEVLLRHPRAAVRALAAREIIRSRPADLDLVRMVEHDQATISVASMSDTPPITPQLMTIAQLVANELDNNGVELPPP